MIIETKNLTKYYGRHKGIEGLNLSVEEGSIFGFIGPNGAGKSTTIRVLLGLISKSSGEATVLGLPLAKKKEILKRVGYLPSEMGFYPNMKVRDFLGYSGKLRGLNDSYETDKLCERLDLDQNKKIDALSFGNRKKVGIVCALQHFPELYLLDEPTSGLDPLIQKEFWTLLKERNETGATIFLSSHVLSEVQRHCKEAAIIKDGKIIIEGTVAELSKTTARRIHLQGVNTIPDLSGIADSSILDNEVNFLYQGDIKLLLEKLHQIPIENLTITEPDLDEVFMHYYEKEESHDL
ncbi:MAG: ABC transporter ATP-binding protein [Gallicola sp.]|nr:ABC transporter ATP-binding protein [Gallicola sp.]